MLHRRELAAAEGKGERIGSVMEVLATALRQSPLQQTLFDLAHHIGRQLQCSRVAIGLVQDDTVRVAALSNAAWFEKNAGVVKLYVSAMEEVCDRMAPVAYQRPDGPGEISSAQAQSAHGRLAQETGARSVLSVPLTLGGKCLGILTLERVEGHPFDAAESAWMDALAGLLPAVIDQKRRAERSYLAHLRDDARALLTRLFGPRHLIWKFSTAAILLLVAAMTLIEMDYRVTAKTVIEGEVQRSAVAPFETFITASHVRPGDTVKQGQLLCELDDRDLRLEQHKWASEREQHSRKLREAMANHDLSAIQVVTAQVQQADAQLALATERLARVKITAPFDGVIISGDLSQLIGSPVEQGKKLFEIAPLEAYRVILQVDEREVRQIQTGQTGKLVISGITGDAIPLNVSKVTPVATARDGRNFFRVEASLRQAPPHLRPGMEGIGKISVGERRLWWILLHSLTDWLRLWLWTWLP
jgi:RND family efflux transporter MFP subunit